MSVYTELSADGGECTVPILGGWTALAFRQGSTVTLGEVIVTKQYTIDLDPAEREELTALVEKGTVAAYRRRHAQILLLADQGADGPALSARALVVEIG